MSLIPQLKKLSKGHEIEKNMKGRMYLSFTDKELKIKMLHNKINYSKVHYWEYPNIYIIIQFSRLSLEKYGY